MADAKDIDEAAAAPVEPIHPRDDMNNDVRAAIASLKGDDGPPVPPSAGSAVVTDPEPAAASTADRDRGSDGKPDHPTDPNRFADGTYKAKAPKDAAPATAAAPDPKSPPPEDPAKASAQPSPAGAPPTSWAADAKATWASLSPAVQAAVLKREDEVSRGFRQYSEQTKAYERALAPVAQAAQRFGLNVEQGIQRLLDGQTFLETQPAQAILWLAQKHGLNLAELAANPPAPQPAARTEAIVPPQVLEQVSSLEQRFNQFFADQNARSLDAFAADPKNPHYAAVEDQLPDIMRELKAVNPALSGVPLLQAAYDRAIWLNPEVRERVFAERQAQTQQQQTQKVAAKAAQASRAAVSVKGSSADTRPPAKPNGAGGGTVYDDVRAAIEQHRAH